LSGKDKELAKIHSRFQKKHKSQQLVKEKQKGPMVLEGTSKQPHGDNAKTRPFYFSPISLSPCREPDVYIS
jgi:hypothetical protein